MRKTQFAHDEEMVLDYNLQNDNTLNDDYINFVPKSSNSHKIKASYDINQITKDEKKSSLLKIKMNPNTENEFALINSNFQILYMSISNDDVYHINTFKENTGRINDICFFKNNESPFNKAFISGSTDGTIKIWDSRASQSVKTIETNKSKVFALDTNSELLAAGVDREVAVWDLKMMKLMHKCSFAHSDEVTTVKFKDNYLMTGGQDNIINIFDLKLGLEMDAVVSTANINQPFASIDFIDDELNYVHAVTNVYTFNIVNMYSCVSAFELDAKNEMYNTDYTLDSFYDKKTHSIDLFCGNHYGSISLFNINIKNGFNVVSQSVINTDFIQSFNSIDKIHVNDDHYVAVSDEGLLYLIDKSNEIDKTAEIINEMSLLEEIEEKGVSSSKANKKKPNKFSNKFTPY